MVPDIRICPQASFSTSPFALVDFSEKVTGDRVKQKNKGRRGIKKSSNLFPAQVCAIFVLGVVFEMKHQCNSKNKNYNEKLVIVIQRQGHTY